MNIANLLIRSLRGGLNDSDPAIALSDDQCTVALNVEFVLSMLGERRKGTSAITLSGNINTSDRIVKLHRHLPTSDETAAQLWALGLISTTTLYLAYKTTSWNAVTISDTALTSTIAPYQWQMQSLHAKLFLAYNSNVDRLHVWDGTSVRRCGLAEPAAPTGADDGGAGTFSGTRYYRVRYTEQVSSVTVRRSEPSDVLTYTPNGNDTGITVTKPAAISEGETHWELEASLDNVNFYVIATTVVGTTTKTDTVAEATGYAVAYDLSEDVGDYALIPSGRFLAVDGDRLLIGGSWEDDALASRVMWTPVRNADGVGNDERLETDTDPSVDLDGYEGGGLTGLSQSSAGSVWAFKRNRTYKLVKRGTRSAAYEVVPISTERGALVNSVINGVDAQGRPATYFLDSNVGPCVAGAGGLRQCGADIRTTWESVNLDATKVVCSGYFDPKKRQVIWNVATGSANIPNLSIVLHVYETEEDKNGLLHRGWATWNGNRATALCACMFADNIEAGVARSYDLQPLLGMEGLGLIHLANQTNADAGVAYAARIVTKPYTLASLIGKFGIMAAQLMATARATATVDMKVHRDLGAETLSSGLTGITFDATGSESQVVKNIDNLSMSELRSVQFEFVDPASPGAQWELNLLSVKRRQEQAS
jgi:hypothetical protein